MKTKPSRKPARSKRSASRRHRAAPRASRDLLLAPMRGADRRQIGGVVIDTAPVANGRVKRVCYPPGFRWSVHMQHIVKSPLCMHAHVGFLARGRVRGEYADGCTFDWSAPRAIVIEPGHDAWVVGKSPAVLIEFDTERTTAERFGLPETHRHN
jgi:hypothetical protein